MLDIRKYAQIEAQIGFIWDAIGPFLLETVGKGVLRHWLDTLPSMRTAYLTDLSDAEWSYLEPHFPAPKSHRSPSAPPTPVRSSTPSSSTYSRRAAVLGDYYRTTENTVGNVLYLVQ